MRPAAILCKITRFFCLPSCSSLALKLCASFVVIGFVSAGCSKLSPSSSLQTDTHDENGKTDKCQVPFLKENLDKLPKTNGLLLVNGWYLKIPDAETRCGVVTSDDGASSHQEQIGYPYLILLSKLEAENDLRLETSGADLDLSVSLTQSLPTDDETQALAKELGFVGDTSTAFRNEIPDFKYVLFEQLVAERFQVLNDVNGRGLFGLAHFSTKKAGFLKDLLSQLKKNGSLVLLADSQGVYPFSSRPNLGFLVYDLSLSSPRKATKVSFLDYLQFAKINWAHAETSPFSDDLVRAMELITIYARSLSEQNFIKEFPAAFRICSETWTPLPPRSLVLAGEFAFYRASFELLSLMDHGHPVNKVNERRLKLVTLGTLSATESFLVALDTMTTRLVDDGQFAKALSVAQLLKSVAGTEGGFSGAVYLGERLSWDEVKMQRAAKILNLGARQVSLSFGDMLESALKYVDQDMSAAQEKSWVEAYSYLLSDSPVEISSGKAQMFADALALVVKRGFSLGDSSLLRDFKTWLQSGFGAELDRKTAFQEAFVWVLDSHCGRNDYELLKDVYSWMTNPYAVAMSKVPAYQKLKALKGFTKFNRKNYEKMRDVFSQISNTYAESYAKPDALEKAQLWILDRDLTQAQLDLRKDAFLFLSGLYSAALKKEQARDKAEDWILKKNLTADKLTKIRDLFTVYSRSMDKQKALARTEREVL